LEDVKLIQSQAARCRDILRDMGRSGGDDALVRAAPLSVVVSEAAEPHMDRGINVIIRTDGLPVGEMEPLDQPVITRRPEIIHGLRNLVQNAVDFARTRVWVEALWTNDFVSVRIVDDGRGYPPHLIGRIGDPFVRTRRSEKDKGVRPEYEGMGLGLFIAKTLLERSGAELSFANGSDPYMTKTSRIEKRGAIVEVVWPRAKIMPENATGGLGENTRFEA